MATLSMQNNLSELDAMLSDLSRATNKAKSVDSSVGYGDYSDYVDGVATASNVSGPTTREGAPVRPPKPRHYSPERRHRGGGGDEGESSSATSTMRLPKARHPPKLQHILTKKRRHDLVKAGPRDDDVMQAPDFPDDSDYDYSTLHPPESLVPELSDEELDEVDAGETPRGDKSMVIHTENNETLKSKYRYLGFGLWENTDPPGPPPPKPSPPTPPPKSEPVWYNCSVVVESTKTSKELDDLFHDLDGFDRMPKRDVELGNAGDGFPSSLGDLWEPFEKEDMSDMFRRAFLEKMALVDDDTRPKHKCAECGDWIYGGLITAQQRKFHPRCFRCGYCRRELRGKDRTFKTDDDGHPYCIECFEKLLGHFGTAHFKRSELP